MKKRKLLPTLSIGLFTFVTLMSLHLDYIRNQLLEYELMIVTIITTFLTIFIWRENKNDTTSQKETEKRYSAAFDYAAIGMAIVDLDGRWLTVNRALCHITGYSEEELLQINLQNLTYTPDLDSDVNYIKRLLDGELESYQVEKRYYHKQGHLMWILLSVSLVRDDEHNPAYFIEQIQDITKQKHAEKQLKYQVSHDILTGLPNRAQLEYDLKRAIASSARHNTKVAVVFLDIDHFKQINDTLGHDMGDMLLKEIGKSLQNCLRLTDTVARLGGDEFVVVLTEITEELLHPLMERLIKALSRPLFINKQSLNITASMGISIYPNHGNEPDQLIKNADVALYQAKNLGRNNYQFYDDLTEEVTEPEFNNTTV